MKQLEILRIFRFAVPAELLFQWISETNYLEQWFCDAAEREGKYYRFGWDNPDGSGSSFDVEVVEEIVPYYLVYQSADGLKTSFTITPDVDCVLLKLTETGFGTDAALYETHLAGWDSFFARLDEALRQTAE